MIFGQLKKLKFLGHFLIKLKLQCDSCGCLRKKKVEYSINLIVYCGDHAIIVKKKKVFKRHKKVNKKFIRILIVVTEKNLRQ